MGLGARNTDASATGQTGATWSDARFSHLDHLEPTVDHFEVRERGNHEGRAGGHAVSFCKRNVHPADKPNWLVKVIVLDHLLAERGLLGGPARLHHLPPLLCRAGLPALRALAPLSAPGHEALGALPVPWVLRLCPSQPFRPRVRAAVAAGAAGKILKVTARALPIALLSRSRLRTGMLQ